MRKRIVGFVLLMIGYFCAAPYFIDFLDGRFGGRWNLLWTGIIFQVTGSALGTAYLLWTGLLQDIAKL
jgi:hypothetical protein